MVVVVVVKRDGGLLKVTLTPSPTSNLVMTTRVGLIAVAQAKTGSNARQREADAKGKLWNKRYSIVEGLVKDFEKEEKMVLKRVGPASTREGLGLETKWDSGRLSSRKRLSEPLLCLALPNFQDMQPRSRGGEVWARGGVVIETAQQGMRDWFAGRGALAQLAH